MSTMHVYLVTEDDWIYHHVTAASEAEAILFAKGHTYSEEEVEWNAVQLRDTRPFTLTLVDASCDPEDQDVADWIGEPGYTVDLTGTHPTVSAACEVWANASSEHDYLTCSELVSQ